MKFSDRFIRSLKTREKRYDLWEGNSHGLGTLGIRVSPTGRKSWIYFYRFNGRARRLTLGSYPKMSLQQANSAFGDALRKLEMGYDPAEIKVEQRALNKQAPTIADLAAIYLEKWAKPRKRTWREDQRSLEVDVLPVWRHRKAAHIERKDVITLLDSIVNRGSPVQANHTLALVRKMFNFAVSRDILQSTPCAQIMMPAPNKQRDRMLTEEEIAVFWQQLCNTHMTEMVKITMRLQLLTAQRSGEIARMAWSEVSLDTGLWTIPSSKAKNNLSHRVPLSKQAVSILLQAKKISGHTLWVFPSPDGANFMTVRAIGRALRRNEEIIGIPHFIPHDLRRTAASHMTSMGISRLVVSKILNHVESGVTAVYDRHSYDREKREALELWGQKLEEIVSKSSRAIE